MILVRRGWRACTDCGAFKGLGAFYKRRQGSGYDSICKACRRQRARANHAAVMADPERRARQRKTNRERRRERWATDPAFAERERQRHRDWLAALPEERRVAMLQDNRIRSRLSRERRGLPIGSRRQAQALGAWRPPAGNNSRHLDPEPLMDVLGDFRAPRNSTVERALSRLRNGGQFVTLAVADAALVAYGRPDLLGVLYPDA